MENQLEYCERRLREFFTNNPDEELTHMGIIIKTRCPSHVVETVTNWMRRDGSLASKRVDGLAHYHLPEEE